jgi:putative hydrolase of the HAD superfamily
MASHSSRSTSFSAEGLVQDVDLLCLDAGNTVVFLDHGRVAKACASRGFHVSAAALNRAEGETKLALERAEELTVTWSESHRPSARGWGQTVGTMLARAGLPADRVPTMLDALWPDHCALNYWSLVPEGLVDALAQARATGVRVAVISNSEGMLEKLFDRLGILGALDQVVDSGVVGVEKPDPRIFKVALDRFGCSPERALHLGDNFSTDVLGARAAGIRVALVDPYGHLMGRHPDVPRVPGAAETARAVAEARRS